MGDARQQWTAMVLAAGFGKRMRPLTDTMPKPLVRLSGRPLIDNVHYLGDQIIAHLAHRTAPQIVISDERDALLDTGGGVVRALAKLGEQPFIIHNSDSVWIEGMGGNLKRLMAAFDANTMDSLLLLARVSASIGYDGPGDFQMGTNGQLTRQQGARVAPFVFTGVSIAHPRLFNDAPAGAFSLNVLWDRALKAGRLHGIRLDGQWMHVGTPDAVGEAELAIARAGTNATAQPGTPA